ncbi:MAG: hypothetical protein Q8M88_12385 [Phenylobacterium sp.]|uniref:hypothetical protein n=1 Tax=Phenylobacterium sp. TaxID=1871053 RepID=UPI002736D503|nr:hypothetical protein [Phenylobacterium sp.]MDP3175220.1 hypothetical protein [Phenylobacterium sp.]
MPDYRFYLLGAEDRVLGAVDIALADDEAATHNAWRLLTDCDAVDVLRGALMLGRVSRSPGDPPRRRMRPPRERR